MPQIYEIYINIEKKSWTSYELIVIKTRTHCNNEENIHNTIGNYNINKCLKIASKFTILTLEALNRNFNILIMFLKTYPCLIY